MKERNLTYDFIRALSCFFVVCIHCSAEVEQMHDTVGFSLGGNILWFTWHHVVNSAVPMFCMLSGALNLRGKVTPPSQFLHRRLIRILLPFILWGAVIFFLRVYKEHWPVDLMLLPMFVRKMLTGEIMGLYWFVYMIIGLYLMTPIIKPFFFNANIKSINYAVLLIIIFYIVRAIWKDDVNWVKHFNWDYYYCFSYYILGYAITNYYQKMKHFKICALIFFLITFSCNIYYDLAVNISQPHILFFFNVALFCCLLNLKIKCSDNKLQVLMFISCASYAVYLSHAAFVSAFGMIGIKEAIPVCVMPFVWGVCSFLAVLTCQYFVKRLRLDKYLW